jgi:hypothetical protein
MSLAWHSMTETLAEEVGFERFWPIADRPEAPVERAIFPHNTPSSGCSMLADPVVHCIPAGVTLP